MSEALAPYARVDRRTGRVCVDPQTNRCEWSSPDAGEAEKAQRDPPAVWCGGDASFAIGSGADSSQTTVESANDGKTAAYHIHQYLQVGDTKPDETTFPLGREEGRIIIEVGQMYV